MSVSIYTHESVNSMGLCNFIVKSLKQLMLENLLIPHRPMLLAIRGVISRQWKESFPKIKWSKCHKLGHVMHAHSLTPLQLDLTVLLSSLPMLNRWNLWVSVYAIQRDNKSYNAAHNDIKESKSSQEIVIVLPFHLKEWGFFHFYSSKPLDSTHFWSPNSTPELLREDRKAENAS